MNIDNRFIHPEKVVVNIGDNVHFSCRSEIQAKWYFKDKQLIKYTLLPNVKILHEKNIIYIHKASKKNEGNYHCHGETHERNLEGLRTMYQTFYAESYLWTKGRVSFTAR